MRVPGSHGRRTSVAAQQLADGSAQGGGLVLRRHRRTLGTLKASAYGLGVRGQSFRAVEKLLGSAQLLAQGPDAGALAARLPRARQELLVLRRWKGDRFHSSHGDA